MQWALVMGGKSYSIGHGFESYPRILYGQFTYLFIMLIVEIYNNFRAVYEHFYIEMPPPWRRKPIALVMSKTYSSSIRVLSTASSTVASTAVSRKWKFWLEWWYLHWIVAKHSRPHFRYQLFASHESAFNQSISSSWSTLSCIALKRWIKIYSLFGAFVRYFVLAVLDFG